MSQAVSYQSFHSPSAIPPPIQSNMGIGGVLWKPPTVSNGNPAANYYDHHLNEQLRLNRYEY